jgi:hypothetical protein
MRNPPRSLRSRELEESVKRFLSIKFIIHALTHMLIFACIVSISWLYLVSILSEFCLYLESFLRKIQSHTYMYVSACILNLS